MTPTPQYPRARYVAMQVVLFLILLGTVALANWVSHRHVIASGSTAPIVLGDFTLYLPSGWDTTQKRTAQTIEITAAEPDETGRQITVLFQQLSNPIAPVDYLSRTGLIGGTWSGQPMTVDGNPGAYVEMMRLVNQGGQRMLLKDLLGCIMLPSGQVITLQLTGPGRVDQDDQQVMQELLTKLQIKAQKKIAPVGQPTPPGWEGI